MRTLDQEISKEEQALEMIEGYTLLINPFIDLHKRGTLPDKASHRYLQRMITGLIDHMMELYPPRKGEETEISEEVSREYNKFIYKIFDKTGILENIPRPRRSLYTIFVTKLIKYLSRE